jgi:hypothetical protein
LAITFKAQFRAAQLRCLNCEQSFLITAPA